MQVEWYGQSAFRLTADGTTVFIDPFGDVAAFSERGWQWDYPAIAGVAADLLLVTHEHLDHNAVDVIGGAPTVLRSTAGRLDSPIGEVVAVASEHDRHAGTERGPNTIYIFELDGIRVAHFGDFGQESLRREQVDAIGDVDLVFVPVGGGATIDGGQAAAVAKRLTPRWLVPMHYRTHRVDFLEPLDGFLLRMPNVHRPGTPRFDTQALPAADGTLVVVPTAP
jgi:L-ascorbate metabolism protein UlaG (beta-lactamase superfamily)